MSTLLTSSTHRYYPGEGECNFDADGLYTGEIERVVPKSRISQSVWRVVFAREMKRCHMRGGTQEL